MKRGELQVSLAIPQRSNAHPRKKHFSPKKNEQSSNNEPTKLPETSPRNQSQPLILVDSTQLGNQNSLRPASNDTSACSQVALVSNQEDMEAKKVSPAEISALQLKLKKNLEQLKGGISILECKVEAKPNQKLPKSHRDRQYFHELTVLPKQNSAPINRKIAKQALRDQFIDSSLVLQNSPRLQKRRVPSHSLLDKIHEEEQQRKRQVIQDIKKKFRPMNVRQIIREGVKWEKQKTGARQERYQSVLQEVNQSRLKSNSKPTGNHLWRGVSHQILQEEAKRLKEMENQKAEERRVRLLYSQQLRQKNKAKIKYRSQIQKQHSLSLPQRTEQSTKNGQSQSPSILSFVDVVDHSKEIMQYKQINRRPSLSRKQLCKLGNRYQSEAATHIKPQSEIEAFMLPLPTSNIEMFLLKERLQRQQAKLKQKQLVEKYSGAKGDGMEIIYSIEKRLSALQQITRANPQINHQS